MSANGKMNGKGKTRERNLAIGAIIVGGGIVAAAALLWPKSAHSGPSISFTPSTIQVGYTGTVTLAGSGFAPNSPLTLTAFGSTSSLGVSTDAMGRFTVPFGSGTWTTPGTVTATITDGAGNSATSTLTITAAGSLTVTASANPISGLIPLTVNFSAVVAGGIAPYTFSWVFGDGGASSAGASVSHTYTIAGMFTAKITVTDSLSASVQASVLITASVNTGVVSLVLSAASATISIGQPDTVTVVAKDISGLPVAGVTPVLNTGSAQATFPATDSTGSSSLAVTYPTAGTYTLLASLGSVSSNTVRVTVIAPVPGVIGFAVAPLTGANPLLVTVSGTVVDINTSLPMPNFSCYVFAFVGAYPTGEPTDCVSIVSPVTTDASGNFSTQFTLTSWPPNAAYPNGIDRRWTFGASTSASPIAGSLCSVTFGTDFYFSNLVADVSP